MSKVYLHRHLVGSVRPETLLKIAKENKIALLTYDLDKLTSIVAIKIWLRQAF
jgi:adenosine deaminase